MPLQSVTSNSCLPNVYMYTLLPPLFSKVQYVHRNTLHADVSLLRLGLHLELLTFTIAKIRSVVKRLNTMSGRDASLRCHAVVFVFRRGLTYCEFNVSARTDFL